MIAVKWEGKPLNKEIYNKLGQVWWGKCSCGTNISINWFKSTGEFLRDSFAGHKCWPYVVSMYRNLHQSHTIKTRAGGISLYGELSPEALFYPNLWTAGMGHCLGIATLSDFGHWTEAPSLEDQPFQTPYMDPMEDTDSAADYFWKTAWQLPVPLYSLWKYQVGREDQ